MLDESRRCGSAGRSHDACGVECPCTSNHDGEPTKGRGVYVLGHSYLENPSQTQDLSCFSRTQGSAGSSLERSAPEPRLLSLAGRTA